MNDEISREALLIYLEDLRTMETVIYQSKTKTAIIDKENEDHEIEVLSEIEKEKPKYPGVYTEREYQRDIKKGKKGLFDSLCFFTVPLFVIFFVFYLLFDSFGFFLTLITAVIAVVAICCHPNVGPKVARRRKEEYEIKQRDYFSKLEKYKDKEQDVREKLTEKQNKWNTAKKEINAEIEEMSIMLQQAYSANIIPMQFRNIEGIYYLYDYLSTSNQGLSEALMQANLEAIKNKLDRMIEMQGIMIIEQAKANAVMIEQNQLILEQARQTAVNTAIAAKYSQISAANSALSLKLQAKQLAYQRADFFLK